jgi:tetratricopeptide (TPR) repeat protein
MGIDFSRRSRTRTSILTLIALAGTALAFAANSLTPPAFAQGILRPPGAEQANPPAIPTPELAPGVVALLETPYLTEAEAAALRIRHGAWDDADLASPRLAAKAALIRGAYLDPSLDSPDADALDRAEALSRRGEPQAALTLLEPQPDSWRLRRIKVESLLDLGRAQDAIATIDAAAPTLPESTTSIDRADEAAEQARCRIIRLRIGEPLERAATNTAYQSILALLADARNRLDPMSPIVPMVEGELLVAHDAYEEGSAALESVFTLNPRSARAYAQAGQAAVAGMDRPRAEAIADRLDLLAAPSLSIDAAILRAGIRVRMGDAQGAIDATAPALAIYPTSRELLAAHAAALARSFDFTKVDEVLARLEELAPTSPDGALAVGAAMSDARQYDEAITYLQRAVERAPAWAHPAVELGLTLTQAGRDDEARKVLERAVNLDPFNKRADNSLLLQRELTTYATHESAHFIVRCKPGVDETLAREMLPVLERIHARVTGSAKGGIDHVPSHKTVVELHPNHRWFAVRVVGMPGVHTIAAATGPLIAMEAPRLGPGHLVGPYDWARVVQHEYVHTVTLSRTKNRLPHWFTEASAVYLEDAPRDWTTVQLLTQAYETGELFDLDTINLGFVRPRKPTDRSLAYAQGHWMYEFMIERFGDRAPLDLMDLYATGATETAAFESILKTSREQFLADFKLWAATQLQAWGMRPRESAAGEGPEGEAQPTLEALFTQEFGEDGPPRSGPPQDAVDRWLESYPNHPDVLKLAISLATPRSGDIVSAANESPKLVDLLERYAVARPVDPLPHRLLAKIRLASTDPTAAIPHLEYLDAREQSTTAYAEELARQYAAQQDWTKALRKSERATQISPYETRVREFAATIALRAGDLDVAERHIRALIALEPAQSVHQRRLEAILARKPGTK